MRTIAAAAVAAVVSLAGCSGGKATWTAYDAGPLVVEFPCKPKPSGVAMKCMRPDGSEYAIRVVDKGLTPEAELAEARQYVREIPKGEVFDDSGFPLKWREVRQFFTIEFRM